MRVVYIASPYTVGDSALNVRAQMEAANELIAMGYCPIAPLMSHFLHMYYPRGYEEWLLIDMELLSRSDVLLRLDGESAGADREVERARELGIPVVSRIADISFVLANIE